MSTASGPDTSALHNTNSTSESPSKEHAMDDLDMSTTEERTDSEDNAYAAALALLDEETF